MCDAAPVQGTPLWMAPEVIRDKGTARGWKRADRWSVGCTVIEMATGKPPFHQFSNPVTAMYNIACNDVTPTVPETMSDQVRVLVYRGCHGGAVLAVVMCILSVFCSFFFLIPRCAHGCAGQEFSKLVLPARRGEAAGCVLVAAASLCHATDDDDAADGAVWSVHAAVDGQRRGPGSVPLLPRQPALGRQDVSHGAQAGPGPCV